jgi:methyltransferase (TIGR00027 family)
MLAITAWWTAAARAHESQRGDRLFEDPWASLLAGPHALSEFDKAVADDGGGTEDLHAVTTRFFDDFLLRVTHTLEVQQVVLAASGLDARAFRLAWPPHTRLFELDQPHVIAYKNCRFSLAGATPACVRETVGVNLNGDWIDSLCRAGFEPAQRSVWLVEQSLCFFDEPAVLHLFDAMARLAAPGSWAGFDVVNGDTLTSPSTRHWNERMAAAGAPWLFTSDEPEALVARFGWSAAVVQPGEHGADFGRYRFPASPRSVPGAPRSFLVTATRL